MIVGEVFLILIKIYVKLVLDVLVKYDIKVIVYIIGGGFIENIIRVIFKGLGLDINKKFWEKFFIFKMIEGFNVVDEREFYKSFNMGIGLVLIVDKENVDDVVNFINNRENDNVDYVDKKYSELLEDKVYIIGEVVDSYEGVELC